MAVIGIVGDNEITDIDRNTEIRLLCYLTFSDNFIKHTAKLLDVSLFQIPEVQHIATWILEYYAENKTAPRDSLKEFINKKRIKFKRFSEIHELTLEAIENPFTDSVENLDYMFKTTEEYMLSRRLEHALSQAIKLVRDRKPFDAIELAKEEIRKTQQTQPDVIKSTPFEEETFNKVISTMEDHVRLFTLPGALGDFVGEIERGSFICFTGPEKRGKTATLVGIAKVALQNRLKVTLFSIGDASEEQLLKRVYATCFGKAYNRKYFNQDVKFPIKDCLKNQLNTCPKGKSKYKVFDGKTVLYDQFKDKHTICTQCEDIMPSFYYMMRKAEPLTCFETDSKQFSKRIKSKTWYNNLHTFVFGQWSKNIEDIKQMVEDDALETGHVPDVIIIDYMDDIDFESGDGLREFRHRNAKLWGKTRGWSIMNNCAIITATQSNKESYHMETLTEGVESEDKRKRGYVTAMYGINQTPIEKEQQIIRYNCLAKRDAEYISSRSVTVLQCLPIGSPFVLSYMREKPNDNEPKRPDAKTGGAKTRYR